MEIQISDNVTVVNEMSPKEFNVKNINLIASLYDKERSKSKGPTFTLT